MTGARTVVLVVVLAGTALTGCGEAGGGAAGDRVADGAAGSRYVAGSGAVVTVPPERREAPIELSGRTLSGDRLDLASLRGAPVVINVWGSWCPPCRREAPDLQAAHERLERDGVAFVGVNTRDQRAQASAYERRFGITFPSVVDEGGRALLALRGAVPPSAIPTTLVLDRAGRVAARVSGPVDTRTLVGLVSDVLAER
jgi:thiol-disulfide isomerase/thioredoxin